MTRVLTLCRHVTLAFQDDVNTVHYPIIDITSTVLLFNFNMRKVCFSGVDVAECLYFFVMFCRSLFVLLSLFLTYCIVCVLLRLTVFDYPFGIYKLYLYYDNTFWQGTNPLIRSKQNDIENLPLLIDQV